MERADRTDRIHRTKPSDRTTERTPDRTAERTPDRTAVRTAGIGRQASDGVREQPRGFSKVLSFGVSLLSLPPPPAQLLGSTRTSRILADFEDYFEYGQRMFQHLMSFALNSCSASLLGERSVPPLS